MNIINAVFGLAAAVVSFAVVVRVSGFSFAETIHPLADDALLIGVVLLAVLAGARLWLERK